jgi:DNA-dependent RNA polymerase auxiliary subunit epsilon
MLRSVCLNALKIFCNFTDQIRLICNLVRSVGINKFNLSEAWQSEKRMIQLTCFIAKSLALLSIPGQSKTKHAKTISFFSKRIGQILRMVQKVIASLVVDIHKQEELEKLENDTVEYIEANLTDCLTQLLDEKSFDKLGMFYLEISEHIEPLEIAVEDIVENHNYNTEFITDLNIKAVDMFVEKYFSLLFDYCLIMINYDEFYLVDYFHELYNRKDPLFETKLVQLFIDKYVCKNLLKHLINYSSDRTDFLVLFHTQYFQTELASRILKNLRFLYDTQLYNVTMNNLMIGDYMKEMQVHLKEISNLFKKWNTVLNQPHLVKMTFEELLNYENEVSSTSDNVECSDNSNCKPTILKPKNNYFNAPLIFLACFLFLP